MTQKSLGEKVRRTIEEHDLLHQSDHIVIGLSGGPDSVCLFDVLLQLAGELNLTIHPVHVNHKFRPGAAERDQEYVENLCKSHGLACRSFTVDCNALAAETGMTSEEAGRKARYDAFYEVAQQVAADPGTATNQVKIAVAQNANDQAETILLRLIRGTGTDGLAGIAYQRYEVRQSKSGEQIGFPVIRPLLDVYREEIEAYCDERGLHPVIDHTNSEAIYTRNKIRLELLPKLEEYNENIMQGLVRLGRIAGDDKDYFWQETEKAFNELLIETNEQLVVLEREGLAELHPAIRHRVVQKAFGTVGLEKDITAERLAAADAIILKKQGPKTVEFPHGYRITVAKGQVTVAKGKVTVSG